MILSLVTLLSLLSSAATADRTITNHPTDTPPSASTIRYTQHCTTYSSQDDCILYTPTKPVGQLPLCGEAFSSQNGTRAVMQVIAIIGDYGMRTQCAASVASLFQNLEKQYTGQRGFDFVISLGDNAYWSGECASYESIARHYYGDYFPPLQQPCNDDTSAVEMTDLPPIKTSSSSYGGLPLSAKFFPVIGNHDWDSFAENGANMTTFPYFQYFPYLQQLPPTAGFPTHSRVRGHYYNYKPHPLIELFALNSNYQSSDKWSSEWLDEHGQQKVWLKNALSQSTAQFKIVYHHHPSVSTAQHDALASFMQWPFEQWGASIVMTGHQHAYERILYSYHENTDKPAKMPYVINGLSGHSWLYSIENCEPAAGSQKRYNQGHGLIVAVMHGDATKSMEQESDVQLDFCFVSTEDGGKIIDEFSLTNEKSAIEQ